MPGEAKNQYVLMLIIEDYKNKKGLRIFPEVRNIHVGKKARLRIKC